MWPSKSLARSASAALAPASPPPTMANVDDVVMSAEPTRRQQLLQRACVADRVATEVVVEVHEHPPAFAAPFGDPVGPLVQLVVRVRPRVQRILRRSVHPDVHQLARRPRDAPQAGA